VWTALKAVFRKKFRTIHIFFIDGMHGMQYFLKHSFFLSLDVLRAVSSS
jgi:hypothetical protein